MINPIEHCRTKEATQKYKVEPYVMAADVYGQKNLTARGGWTWYTGSASWMYEAGIKYILGLNIQNNILTVNPCTCDNWNEYDMVYKYGTTIYNIKVKKTKYDRDINRLNNGEISIKENGVIDKAIELRDDGLIHDIFVQILK